MVGCSMGFAAVNILVNITIVVAWGLMALRAVNLSAVFMNLAKSPRKLLSRVYVSIVSPGFPPKISNCIIIWVFVLFGQFWAFICVLTIEP